MKKLFKKIILFTILLFTLNIMPVQVDAQCPMCRMSAESNLNNGGTTGKGLNAGILYMLLTPYVLVGSIAFLWYRNRKKEADDFDAVQH